MTIDIDKFKDKLFARKLSRREFHATLAAVGLTVTASPLMPGKAQAAAEDHPLFFGWSGYDDEALFPAYMEKYGELPRFTFWGDEEEGVTKLQSGFRPDIIFPCNYKVAKWHATGLIDDVDVDRLKFWPDVMESLKNINGTVINGKHVWVPIDWGQTSIVYRTDLAPEYIDNESWSILWDEKYKGRLAMFDSLVDGVSIAAIMAGVDPFDFTDETIEKTRVKMKELVPLLRFFSNDPTTLEQGIASGELVAATAWNESITRLKAQGLPVAFMNPKEGAMTWVCGLSIIKGTKHLDKVYEIIDAMLDPRGSKYEIEEFGYGSSTKTAFDLVDEAKLAELGLSRNPDDILSGGIYQQAITNEEKLQEMFDEVKVGL